MMGIFINKMVTWAINQRNGIWYSNISKSQLRQAKPCWSWHSVQMTKSFSSDPITLRVGWKEKSFPFTCNKWEMRAVSNWSKPRTLKEDWKLSQVSWHPDEGWNYKTPPFFFANPWCNLCLCQDPSHNSSITLSTAELLCTAPGSKSLAPTMVIQPLAGSSPDFPIPTAQHFMFPCRYEQRVSIPGELRLCKTNRGKGKVYNGT